MLEVLILLGRVWVQAASVPQLSRLPYGSMTAAWAAAAAARTAAFMQLLDAAYPGSIAGIHLAGLAAGELRYECVPVPRC